MTADERLELDVVFQAESAERRRAETYRTTLNAIKNSLDRLIGKYSPGIVVKVREEHYQKRIYRLYAVDGDSDREIALYWGACPAEHKSFVDDLAKDANDYLSRMVWY